MNVDSTGNDQANETRDGDGMPDTANVMDAKVFEIITQTNTFPESIMPECEQIPLAKSELPPEDPSIPLELSNLSTPAAHPLVVQHFPYGNPGAPINSTRGSSIYTTS